MKRCAVIWRRMASSHMSRHPHEDHATPPLNERGILLLTTYASIAAFALLIQVFMVRSLTEIRVTNWYRDEAQALRAAEAGLDATLHFFRTTSVRECKDFTMSATGFNEFGDGTDPCGNALQQAHDDANAVLRSVGASYQVQVVGATADKTIRIRGLSSGRGVPSPGTTQAFQEMAVGIRLLPHIGHGIAGYNRVIIGADADVTGDVTSFGTAPDAVRIRPGALVHDGMVSVGALWDRVTGGVHTDPSDSSSPPYTNSADVISNPTPSDPYTVQNPRNYVGDQPNQAPFDRIVLDDFVTIGGHLAIRGGNGAAVTTSIQTDPTIPDDKTQHWVQLSGRTTLYDVRRVAQGYHLPAEWSAVKQELSKPLADIVTDAHLDEHTCIDAPLSAEDLTVGDAPPPYTSSSQPANPSNVFCFSYINIGRNVELTFDSPTGTPVIVYVTGTIPDRDGDKAVAIGDGASVSAIKMGTVIPNGVTLKIANQVAGTNAVRFWGNAVFHGSIQAPNSLVWIGDFADVNQGITIDGASLIADTVRIGKNVSIAMPSGTSLLDPAFTLDDRVPPHYVGWSGPPPDDH